MMLEWSIAPYGSSSSAADMSSNAVSSLDVSVTGHPAVRLSLNIADGFAPKRFVRLLSIRGFPMRRFFAWAHEVQYFSVGIAVPLA
jgi:hypothetical protein